MSLKPEVSSDNKIPKFGIRNYEIETKEQDNKTKRNICTYHFNFGFPKEVFATFLF